MSDTIAAARDRAVAYAGALKRTAGDFLSTRLFVAIAGLALVMFASQSVFAPHRPPPVAPPPLSALGLTPGLPPVELLPEVQAELDKAAQAAAPYAQDAAAAALANDSLVKFLNYGGAAAALILLLVGLWMQHRQARGPGDGDRWWIRR